MANEMPVCWHAMDGVETLKASIQAFLLSFLTVFPQNAFAQADPAEMKEWSAMYDRIDKEVSAYAMKWNLPSYWRTYCRTEYNDETSKHPRDGSIPLGITNWKTLDTDAFRSSLGILASYETAWEIRCLAKIKQDLIAADQKQ